MNNLLIPPCYGCEKRNSTCHGTCKPYLDYADQKKKISVIEKKERARNGDFNNSRGQR